MQRINNSQDELLALDLAIQSRNFSEIEKIIRYTRSGLSKSYFRRVIKTCLENNDDQMLRGLNPGCDFYILNPGDDLYMEAIETSTLPVIKELEQLLHVNINKTDALYKAASRGNIEIIEYLLQKGADVNKKNEGLTPLEAALYFSGSRRAIKLLLDHGADTEACIKNAKVRHDIIEFMKDADFSFNPKDLLQTRVEKLEAELNLLKTKNESLEQKLQKLQNELSNQQTNSPSRLKMFR